MPGKASRGHDQKILWVEGRWNSNPNFVPALLQRGFHVRRVSSGKHALEELVGQDHDLVVVDAASMRTTGVRICQSLRERVNGIPIMLISGPDRVVDKGFGSANVVLMMPFTQRKLLNRIVPLLPDEEGGALKSGPIHLNLDNKCVTAYGKKTQLTPRLVRLLRMLIDHKGEAIERDELFKKVWRTDYTGDTRTLDVHISWLRQAIEKNPTKPKLLTTLRGQGYRLDI